MYHYFYWSEYQMIDTRVSRYISGDATLYFTSSFKKGNLPVSRSITAPLSAMLFIMYADFLKAPFSVPFGVPTPKFSSTLSPIIDTWTQSGTEDTASKMEIFAQYASSLWPNSPFITFFNLKNELFFTTIEDIFRLEVPVATYTLKEDEQGEQRDGYIIQDYKIIFDGAEINKANYKKKFWTVNDLGIYESSEKDIGDVPIKTNPALDKILIRKDYIEDTQSSEIYGIVEKFPALFLEQDDISRFSGYKNSRFLDSFFSYKMIITIPFNKDLVSGSLLKLEIQSSALLKMVNFEMSGTWMVLESTHYMDEENVAQSIVTIGKSAVAVYPGHTFYFDFL